MEAGRLHDYNLSMSTDLSQELLHRSLTAPLSGSDDGSDGGRAQAGEAPRDSQRDEHRTATAPRTDANHFWSNYLASRSVSISSRDRRLLALAGLGPSRDDSESEEDGGGHQEGPQRAAGATEHLQHDDDWPASGSDASSEADARVGASELPLSQESGSGSGHQPGPQPQTQPDISHSPVGAESDTYGRRYRRETMGSGILVRGNADGEGQQEPFLHHPAAHGRHGIGGELMGFDDQEEASRPPPASEALVELPLRSPQPLAPRAGPASSLVQRYLDQLLHGHSEQPKPMLSSAGLHTAKQGEGEPQGSYSPERHPSPRHPSRPSSPAPQPSLAWEPPGAHPMGETHREAVSQLAQGTALSVADSHGPGQAEIIGNCTAVAPPASPQTQPALSADSRLSEQQTQARATNLSPIWSQATGQAMPPASPAQPLPTFDRLDFTSQQPDPEASPDQSAQRATAGRQEESDWLTGQGIGAENVRGGRREHRSALQSSGWAAESAPHSAGLPSRPTSQKRGGASAEGSRPSAGGRRAASGSSRLRRRAALQNLKLQQRTAPGHLRRADDTGQPLRRDEAALPVRPSYLMARQTSASSSKGAESSVADYGPGATALRSQASPPPMDLLVEAEERLEALQDLMSLAGAKPSSHPPPSSSTGREAPHLPSGSRSPGSGPGGPQARHLWPQQDSPSQANAERAAAELIGRLRALQAIATERIAASDARGAPTDRQGHPTAAPGSSVAAEDGHWRQGVTLAEDAEPSEPIGSAYEEADPRRSIPSPHRQGRGLDSRLAGPHPQQPSDPSGHAGAGVAAGSALRDGSDFVVEADKEPLASLGRAPGWPPAVAGGPRPPAQADHSHTASSIGQQATGSPEGLDDSWLVRMLEGASPLCHRRQAQCSVAPANSVGLPSQGQQPGHGSPARQVAPPRPLAAVGSPSVVCSGSETNAGLSGLQSRGWSTPAIASASEETEKPSWEPQLWELLGDMESSVAACASSASPQETEARPLPPSMAAGPQATRPASLESPRPRVRHPEVKVSRYLRQRQEDEEQDRFQRLLQLSEELGFTNHHRATPPAVAVGQLAHGPATDDGGSSSSGCSGRGGVSSSSPSPCPSSAASVGVSKEPMTSPRPAGVGSSAAVELGRLAVEADRLGYSLEAVRLNLEQLTSQGDIAAAASPSWGHESTPLPIPRAQIAHHGVATSSAVARTQAGIPRPYESSTDPVATHSTISGYAPRRHALPRNRKSTTTDRPTGRDSPPAAAETAPSSGVPTRDWEPAPRRREPVSSSSAGFRFVRHESDGESAGGDSTPRLWWGSREGTGHKPQPKHAQPRPLTSAARRLAPEPGLRHFDRLEGRHDEGDEPDATVLELRGAREALAVAEATAAGLRERLRRQKAQVARLVGDGASQGRSPRDADETTGWESMERAAGAVKSRVQSLRLDLGRAGHGQDNRQAAPAVCHGLARLVTVCHQIERQASSVRSTCATAGRESLTLLERCSRALADCEASAEEICQLQHREGLLALGLASAAPELTEGGDSILSRAARLADMAADVSHELETAGATAGRTETEAAKLSARLVASEEELAALLAKASGLEQQASHLLVELPNVPAWQPAEGRSSGRSTQPQRQLRFTPLVPHRSDPSDLLGPSRGGDGPTRREEAQREQSHPRPQPERLSACRPTTEPTGDKSHEHSHPPPAAPEEAAEVSKKPHADDGSGNLEAPSASLAAALRRVQGSKCTARRARRLSETAERLQARLSSPSGQLLAGASPSNRLQMRRPQPAKPPPDSSSSSSSWSSD